jgi:uncharacterized membrane protein YbaN (DUF454 family)
MLKFFYFNRLTQQLQELVTESAQENNKCTKNRKHKDMPKHNKIKITLTAITTTTIIIIIIM